MLCLHMHVMHVNESENALWLKGPSAGTFRAARLLIESADGGWRQMDPGWEDKTTNNQKVNLTRTIPNNAERTMRKNS